jgi:hypothetical protein
MATRFVTREVALEKDEATAGRRVLYYEAATAESVTVTVSKGGGAFGASTSTAAAVTGTCYALTIAAADLDTVGEVAWCLTGATDTTYLIGPRVVAHDPWDITASVLGALVATYKATAGSVADLLNRINRWCGAGYVKTDTSDNTIKLYDGATSGGTLLQTVTKATTGTVTDLTPS